MFSDYNVTLSIINNRQVGITARNYYLMPGHACGLAAVDAQQRTVHFVLTF